MIARRELLWSAAAAAAMAQSPSFDQLPDIRSVTPDLAVPPLRTGVAPKAGVRLQDTLPAWQGSRVYHALYLPRDWKPERQRQRRHRYPVIVEYAGNGNYRNRYGDVSEGVPEGSSLGYGLSGGERHLWLCLPYIDSAARAIQINWWGDIAATLAYCEEAIERVCAQFGGDPARVLLCGFSRGAIACNFLGLHNDRIARLWRAFFCYSHYDGVRTNWPYEGVDRAAALARLRRLHGRPQFIIHEGGSVDPAREYLAATGVKGRFTFQPLSFRNHNDQWVLRDIPERRIARQWLAGVMR